MSVNESSEAPVSFQKKPFASQASIRKKWAVLAKSQCLKRWRGMQMGTIRTGNSQAISGNS